MLMKCYIKIVAILDDKICLWLQVNGFVHLAMVQYHLNENIWRKIFNYSLRGQSERTTFKFQKWLNYSEI